jgi:hypothetical protein
MRTSRFFVSLIALAVLFLAVSPGIGQETNPSKGTVSIDITGVAAGVGVSWGSGTLSFEGKRYPFRIQGLSVGDVGISTARAVGTVHNLKNVADFPGNYMAVGAGVTVAGGMAGQTMQNQRGVIIDLYSTTQGVQLTIGPQGFGIEMR